MTGDTVRAPQVKLPDEMRAAHAGDWRQLGDIFTEAFEADPVNVWIFGERRAIGEAFGTLAKHVYLKRGFCHLKGDDGATMWSHSSASRELGLLPTLGLVSAMQAYGSDGAIKRAITAGKALHREHPKAPHLYLFAIGTRKAARGKGLGKRLMAPVLAAADRDGLPCYLENSNPANTGFYRSCGFERMKLFEPGPGGPVLEAMWREPRHEA